MKHNFIKIWYIFGAVAAIGMIVSIVLELILDINLSNIFAVLLLIWFISFYVYIIIYDIKRGK